VAKHVPHTVQKDSHGSPRPRPLTDGRSSGAIDSAAIAALARGALDDHPVTWTSYAELCSAGGLDRGVALVVARLLVPEPTGDHWFRIRNSDGVYNAVGGQWG
jgi:hypothetical protein